MNEVRGSEERGSGRSEVESSVGRGTVVLSWGVGGVAARHGELGSGGVWASMRSMTWRCGSANAETRYMTIREARMVFLRSTAISKEIGADPDSTFREIPTPRGLQSDDRPAIRLRFHRCCACARS